MVESIDRVALWNLVATVDAFLSSGFTPAELMRWVHPGLVANTQGTGMGGMTSMRELYINTLLGEAKANDIMSGAESRKTALEGATVTIKANASPEGKLFGSVGPRDIAEAFSAAGHALEKSEVVMGEGPIRHTGEFEIHVHLHADVQTTVKVTVAAEE